jgi:hypothetical protein
MALHFGLVAGITLVLAALAWLAVAGRTRWSVRAGAVGILIFCIGLGFATVPELLGRPKPVGQAWLEENEPQSRLLAARMEPEVGIYLWLLFPGEAAPRAYEVRWQKKLAEKIDAAMSEAARRGLDVVINAPMSKWALFDAGDFPVTIVPPSPLPQKSRPNRPRKVDPGI